MNIRSIVNEHRLTNAIIHTVSSLALTILFDRETSVRHSGLITLALSCAVETVRLKVRKIGAAKTSNNHKLNSMSSFLEQDALRKAEKTDDVWANYHYAISG